MRSCAHEPPVRWIRTGARVSAAVWLLFAADTHATQPDYLSLFRDPLALQTSPPPSDTGLSRVKSLDYDDLQIMGFVAARNATDAASYRAYLGFGHHAELGSLAKITSRAFYGTGTYDGVNVKSSALPEEVRAHGDLLGSWVGGEWRLESALSARHTFVASVDYRQRTGLELPDLNGRLVRPSTLSKAQPARKVGIITKNDVTLSRDLALKVRMRYTQQATAQASAVDPRVELIYKPEQTATLSAIFDQADSAPFSKQRAYHPWASAEVESNRIRNYELGYEKRLWQSNGVRLSAFRYDVHGLLARATDANGVLQTATARIGTAGFEVGVERNGSRGTRARVSYARQQTTDWLAGSSVGNLGQRLTKLAVDVPILPNRLRTAFELQHLDIAGSFISEQERAFMIGNLTVATTGDANAPRVSFGMRNVFGAKPAGSGAQLLSFIPPDGRSLRLDVTRTL
jgi:hypothetical protein